MTVKERLYAVALERNLRPGTVASYAGFLARLGVLEMEVDAVSKASVLEALWAIEKPNMRRSAVIVVRSVFGWDLKIPTTVAKRYDLPDEDSLRLALMLTAFETRGLLMMYAGLRIGEACAVAKTDATGDRLSVDKQVLYNRTTKRYHLGPVKTREASIVIPLWLGQRVATLGAWDKTDTVRHAITRAGRKVGLTLNPHQLRHWYATTMIERGVPFNVVADQMRHHDVAFTLRTYGQSRAEQSIKDIFG